MATIQKRTWLSRGPAGHKVRKVAWGYTLQLEGKQKRKFDAAWTREDAEKALATALLEPPKSAIEPELSPQVRATFGAAVERYLVAKRRTKRSIREDERVLRRFTEYFGADTPLTEITAARISAWKDADLARTVPGGKPVTVATVNRSLSALKHLLRLAWREWEILDKVPRITLEKESEGLLRYLSDEEIARLLTACEGQRTRHPYLGALVTIALNTGMRRGEIMGLTWDRVKFDRGVLVLEGIHAKGKTRREIPMTDTVDALLSAWPGPRQGRLFPAGRPDRGYLHALETAELADVTFHTLRHTFASHFMMRGGNLYELQKLLGHKDITMTMRYAHLSPEHLRASMERMEGITPAFSTSSAHSLPATIDNAVPAGS